MAITRTSGLSEGVGSKIKELDAVWLGDDRVVTAVQGTNGRTQLIVWHIDDHGNVTRAGDSGDEGEVGTNLSVTRAGSVKLTFSGPNVPMVALAYKRSDDNQLAIRLYGVTNDGGVVRLKHAFATFGLSPRAVCWGLGDEATPRLAVIDGSGNLRIAGLKVTPNHGQIAGRL